MSAIITDDTLPALINLIYEAACDPSRWPDFLRAFARALEGRGSVLFNHNFETGEGSTTDANSLNVAVDFDPEFLKAYEEHFSHVNVWARNERMLKEGRAVTGSMLFPARDRSKTEWYGDYLRPQDYFHLIGGVVVRDGSWATHFSSLRSRRAGDFSAEQVRLYQTLLPHLSRAVRMQRRFAFLQNISNSSLAVLDTVPAAVMLLDSSARVLHANASAEAELRRADPLRLDPARVISVRGAGSARASVHTLIRGALDPERSDGERLPTVAQVPRHNGEMLSVQALPLPQSHCAARNTMMSGRFAAFALVVHSSRSRVPTIGLDLLRHVYRLTPAEVQVALAIAEGETIKEYAERRRITRNTAASQLKRAFDKTGLRRQSDMVRWLLQCGAMRCPSA